MSLPPSIPPGPWWTLRECDTALGAPKGTSFRAFKAHRDRWQEGRHFRRLDARMHAAEIERLRRGNRIYPNSVHVVLLSAEAASIIGVRLE